MKFGRTLALIMLFASAIYACALCSLYTPTAHTSIKFNLKNDVIKSATLTWIFSENFTNLTLQSYDENADKQLGKNEAWNIQKSILDYIVPRGYLTNISFYDGDSETQQLPHKTLSQRVFLEGGRLNFEYVLQLNLSAKDGRVVVFDITDYEGFFNFKISPDEPYALGSGLYVVPNVNLNTAFFQMSAKAPKISQKPPLSSVIKAQNLEQIDALDEAKFDSLSSMNVKFLDRLKELIKVNETDFSAFNLALLAAVSFFYGFLHAAGPGHAKMLTTSYFVANGGDYKKAFAFAMKVGFLHVAGAFLLVAASYFFLNAFLTNKVGDTASVITKISAVVIVFVSAFMLYAKFKKLLAKPKFSFQVATQTSKITSANLPNLHDEACGCEACKSANLSPKNVSEWLVVLAGSLVPCPGTILIFVLAFSLNSYLTGITSGVFMGLGMGFVIFLAAVFGFKAKGALKFASLRVYAEFAALLVMFGLGIFMFYISERVSVL